MAVVKSPKNAKHKKLWTRKLSKQLFNSRGTIPSSLACKDLVTKPYTKTYSWDKPEPYFKRLVKISLLRTIFRSRRTFYKC